MEEVFRKIEDNIFESQQKKETDVENKDTNEDTTNDSTQLHKNEKKILKTEAKENRQSKLHLEKPEEIEEEKNEINEKEEKKDKKLDNFDDDEYYDYGRRDKTGIHFQIISDFNVSIEIVPDELLRDDVKELIAKYKGVYDDSTKLWILPYINYEPLYKELYQLEGISYQLHKVGSIAKECFEHKELTTLIIKRKKEDEKIDYTNEIRERKIEQLPEKIQKTLYDFQIEGINFGIKHHCRFLLADEMGVGKTIQAISLAYIYRDSWPVLIVCPGSMKYLWKGEIRAWLGLKDHRVNIINSSKQKLSTEAYFYIISYDLVKNILKKLKNMTFDFVILDEAHSIKNRDSLRAKNILPIAVRAKRLIIMTGTPLLAKPYEGYPLLYALRPDLFCYFKKFAYRYCDPQPTPFGINWSGTSNTKELHWILSTLMVRRLKRDVLNQLPPKRRQKIFIKTDPNIIEEIKKVRTIKGKKGTLDAYSLTSKAKIEGVYEFIKDLLETEEKFIVFAYHYDMLNRIEELTKEKNIEYIRIDGSTRQDIRYDYVNNFQRNNNCRVAILSIIAASTGITLTSAHMVIFAELTWTPSIMIQAEDRAHRIGQKCDFVDIKYLYGPETLDDFILDKLQKKLTIVSTTLDDKKEVLGVKADPKLIHAGKTSKELIEYELGEEFIDEDNENPDDLEKKMLNDLGEESEGKKKRGRKKKTEKKSKKNVRSKTTDIDKIDDTDNVKSNSKNKEPKYPKPSKKATSLSDLKKESVPKLSGIKKLRKIWASDNKAKSANKYNKNKSENIIRDEDFSKKTILTIINDNKNIIKQKLDNNINNENNKMDLIEKPVYNGKENVDEKNNLNKNFNANEKHEDYQKNLSINLHKKNMRRIVNLEDTKQTQKSIIDFIDEKNVEDADKEGTKRLLFPKNNNIYNENNNNENIIQNTNDKVPII
jgi:SWI/SNF-related matrix-associated actin-dependent regulator 1 of chromatin subfamily A